MVLSRDQKVTKSSMALRSKTPSTIKRPLHNFRFFPRLVDWGKKRHFRFVIAASPGGGVGDGDGTTNQPSVSPEPKPSRTGTPSKSPVDSVKKSELVNVKERLDVSWAEVKDIARPGKHRSSKTEWPDPSPPLRISEGEKRRRLPWKVEFSVALSKQEVEEDFMRILGRKPPSMPKNKRPRKVQEKVDSLFPGMLIKEVTSNSFKLRRR